MFKRWSVVIFLVLLLLAGIFLQSGYCAEQSKSSSRLSKSQTSVFSYDKAEIPKAKPWTDKPFKNNPDNFQFAIIGDRGGGANPRGTFDKAMDQLNLLQPEFVMGVGDLIEGYTNERGKVEAEWKEAEKILDKLQMRYFLVRGNHDVNFPVTKEVWREQFGPGYYYFIYKNVLFIALDTEDAERKFPPNMEQDIKTYNKLKEEDPAAAKKWLAEWIKTPEAIEAFGHGNKVEFPEKQRAWLKKTLAKHPNVRWTFLFLHEPVWDNPSDSFKEIQKLLKGRKHTFFAGHTHYYDYDLVDGVEYITMGPAGAAFMQEGPGNVDHLMWVTMTGEGPMMGNIALKGLFDRKGLDPAMFGAYDRAPGSKGAEKKEEPKAKEKK